jgi:hypothetical protein
MAANPNPSRQTDAQWYLWEELHRLEPKSQLGGIYAFKSGYHGTRDDNKKNWPGNYSIVDSEDKGGPSDKSGALDWTFPDAQSGRYDTIIKYTKRLLASAQDPKDTRLSGWREFYGQADKDTHVEGWDCRYCLAATSDPSHLWHLHFSEDRDKVESYDNKNALLSVLQGETWEDYMSGLTPQQADNLTAIDKRLYGIFDNEPTVTFKTADGVSRTETNNNYVVLKDLQDRIAVLEVGGVDEDALAQKVATLVVQQLGGLVYKPEAA